MGDYMGTGRLGREERRELTCVAGKRLCLFLKAVWGEVALFLDENEVPS